MSLETRLRRLEAKTAPTREKDVSQLSDEELLERMKGSTQRVLATIRSQSQEAELSPQDLDFLRRMACYPGVRQQLTEAESQRLGLPPRFPPGERPPI